MIREFSMTLRCVFQFMAVSCRKFEGKFDACSALSASRRHFSPTLKRVLALALISSLFAGHAFSLTPKSIALGSSEQIWLSDTTDSKLLFRLNNETHRFEEVDSNIIVDKLDVSASGVVLALSAEQLFIWDDSSDSFVVHPGQQKLEAISLGKQSIWGLLNGEAYQWNIDTNSFDDMDQSLTAIAVAKEDDSVWGLDSSGELYRFNPHSQQFDAKNAGASGLSSLYVRNQYSVWGRDSQGTIKQWDPVKQQFIEVSTRLTALNVTHFAVDEYDMFHGVNDKGLNYRSVAAEQVDYSVASLLSKPVTTFAPHGSHHILYNHDSQIYHAYVPLGNVSTKTWLGASPVPGSVIGTDLNLLVDESGDLHASWIAGVGNNSEVYYATGSKDESIGGYRWTIATQVSTDGAQDRGLSMILNQSGEPIFLSSKRDINSQHMEADNYQQALSDSAILSYDIDSMGNVNPGYTPAAIEHNALRYILRHPGLESTVSEGSPPFAYVIRPGTNLGVSVDIGKIFEVEVMARAGQIDRKENGEAELGINLELDVTLAAKTPGGEEEGGPEPELEFEIISAVKHSLTNKDEQLEIEVELELELEIPLLQEAAPEAAPAIAAAKLFGLDFELNAIMSWAWTVSEWTKEGPEDEEEEACGREEYQMVTLTRRVKLDTSAMPTFFKVVDTSGASPPATGTHPSDMRYHVDLSGFTNYLAQTIGGSLFGGSSSLNSRYASTSPELGGPSFEKDSYKHWTLGLGIKGVLGEGEGNDGIEFGMQTGVKFNSAINSSDPDTVEEYAKIWMKAAIFKWEILNLSFKEALSSQYAPGGSSAVHAEGLVLGDGESSNTVDEGRIAIVTLSDGSLLGTFKQETGDNDFEAIYTIVGKFESSGLIDWDESSVKRIEGSGGFSNDPVITAYTDNSTENIVIAWSGVPASDEDVKSLAATPAGKAYVLESLDNKVDLSKLSTGKSSEGQGFYYSNNKALYGIGAAVAALGDVDGNGKNDFIIGAPDAEFEEGRAYLQFGESYDSQLDNAIDSRMGAQGLVMSGPVDSELGKAVSSVGDLDKDGLADFVVTAPGNNDAQGVAYVISGSKTLAQSKGIVDIETSPLVTHTLTGSAANSQFGSAVTGGHDISGDGAMDIVVGAEGENAIYVYTHPEQTPWRLVVSEAGDQSNNIYNPIGSEVASVGDINGDKAGDLLIGTSGGAYVLLGGKRLQNYVESTVVSWMVPASEDGEVAPYQVIASFSGVDSDKDGILRGRATSPGASLAGNYSNELTAYRLDVFQKGALVESLDQEAQAKISRFNLNFDLNQQQLLAAGGQGQADGLFVGDSIQWQVYSGGAESSKVAMQAVWETGGDNAYTLTLDFAGQDVDKDGVLRGRAKNPTSLDGKYKNELTDWTLTFSQSGKTLYQVSLSKQQSRSDFNFNYDMLNQTIGLGKWASVTGLNIGDTTRNTYNLFSGGTQITIYSHDASGTKHNVLNSAPAFVYTDEGLQGSASNSANVAALWLMSSSDNVASSTAGSRAFKKLASTNSLPLDKLHLMPGLGINISNNASGFLHVAAAGDVNADGLADILLGYGTGQNFNYDTVPGEGYVIFGDKTLSNTVELKLQNIETEKQGQILVAGGSLAGVGDVNGDSFDDVIVFDPAPVSGSALGTLYYGFDYQSASKLNAGITIGQASEELELSGLSLASIGDLNGDGKSEVVVGAPYALDSDVAQNISNKTRIYQAVMPVTSGSSFTVAPFSATQATGVALKDIDVTGGGPLITWLETSDEQGGESLLYSSFMNSGIWGTASLIRTIAGSMSHVAISDMAAVSEKTKLAPNVIWQEQTPSGNSSFWQAAYDTFSANWTVQQSDLIPGTNTDLAAYNLDAGLTIDGSTYQVVDSSARETDGSVTVSIERSGDLSKSQTVQYRTVDHSAVAGADYKHVSGKLHFSKGQRFKKITIKLLVDALPEKREEVFIELLHKSKDAYRSWKGRRLAGPAVVMGTLGIEDEDPVLELTAIDSGFIMSSEEKSYLGGALSPAGDIDNNGWDDFLVGAEKFENNTGRAYLVKGQASIEIKDMSQDLDLMTSANDAVIFKAVDEGGFFGQAVAAGSTGKNLKNNFVAISQPGSEADIGKVYLFRGTDLGKPSISMDATGIRYIEGDKESSGARFGTAMITADIDGNKKDDLIILATGENGEESTEGAGTEGKVYIVYDSFIDGSSSGSLDSLNPDVDIIVNSSGKGFGTALATGDFDGDGYTDLVLGSPESNKVESESCGTEDSGGYVFVIWGTGSQLGNLDVNKLGETGRTFVGIADVVEAPDKNLVGDGDSTRPTEMPMVGSVIVDGIGNAATMLNLNGDTNADGKAIDDLVIGAPKATLSNKGPDAMVQLADINKGRVYVLFGGKHWRSTEEDYELEELFGDDYKEGAIFEGISSYGSVGSSVANAGAFRGSADETGVEDLLIGAPTVGASAGQSYVVFGSKSHYDFDDMSQEDNPNIQWLNPLGNAAHPNIPLIFTFQGQIMTADASTGDDGSGTENAGGLGVTLASVGDINKDNANDLVIAAPTIQVNDVSQLYLPIGHEWIKPGQSLNVKHLRSDNGFVIENSGVPFDIRDFNNDGYDDFVITGANPEIVLGHNTLTNSNGTKQYPLVFDSEAHSGWSSYWEFDDDYAVYIRFYGDDKDGDGYIRGRGNSSSLADTKKNELSDWYLVVTQKGSIKFAVDLNSQMISKEFNFNFDVANAEISIDGAKGDLNGLDIGGADSGEYHVYAKSNKVYGDLAAPTEENNLFAGDVNTDAAQIQHARNWQVTWYGTNGYRVQLEFQGIDADGDGMLRGRGSDPSKVAGGYGNELSDWTMTVYSGDDEVYVLDWGVQQQRSSFNFNYDYLAGQVVAAGNWETVVGLNVGMATNSTDSSTHYNFLWENGRVLLEKMPKSGAGNTHVAYKGIGFTNELLSSAGSSGLTLHRAYWKGSKGVYTVYVDFAGADRDGDKVIRGRGIDSFDKTYTNELVYYSVRFYRHGELMESYSYDEQINNNLMYDDEFNFNYNVKNNQVLASAGERSPSGIHLGPDLADNTYTLLLCTCNTSEIAVYTYSEEQDHTARSNTAFISSSEPAVSTGPIASGDFNADGKSDFILFSNIAAASPAYLNSFELSSGLTVRSYFGDENVEKSLANVEQRKIPLQYISAVKSGDLNGDGYFDVVLSGLNSVENKTYLYAYYGSATGLKWDEPEILYQQNDNSSRYLLSILDINNDGQDDVVTHGLTMPAGVVPIIDDIGYCMTPDKIKNLYTYGADKLGGESKWHEISLLDSVFSGTTMKESDVGSVCSIESGKPVDIDNDGLVDLNLHFRFNDSLGEVSFVLRSTGNFTFTDGVSSWKRLWIGHPTTYSIDGYKQVISSTQDSYSRPQVTGVGDFNHDGIDDVLLTNSAPSGANDHGRAAYSYVMYGDTDIWSNTGVIQLQAQQSDYSGPIGMMGIKGFDNLSGGYVASAANDLNGDGFADILMSDQDSNLSYGIYGFRTSHSTLTDYIRGTEGNDSLVQVASKNTVVNVEALGGDDVIRTVRSVKDSFTPYKLVIDAGPGNDDIGISTVDSSLIIKIDGGEGFDILRINENLSGAANTIDLTQISRRVRNIEMINLGDDNGLSFRYLDVRNLTQGANTLLIRGQHSFAKPAYGDHWTFIDSATTYKGVWYDVYQYTPKDDQGQVQDSNIQVWIETDGVAWRPLVTN